MAKGNIKRYSAAKKKEILNFVKNYNKKTGRGGQAAAAKKYKVGALSIANWSKKEAPAGAKTSKKKARTAKSGARSESLASILRQMTEIHEKVSELNAEMNGLYAYATQIIRDRASSEATQSKSTGAGNKMLKKRKTRSKLTPQMTKERRWTNSEGKTIIATLMKIKDDTAVLRVKGGAIYRYPIAGLSEKNQTELRKLAS